MKLSRIHLIAVIAFTCTSVFAAYLQRGARVAQQVTRSVATTPASQYSTMAAKKATIRVSPTAIRQTPQWGRFFSQAATTQEKTLEKRSPHIEKEIEPQFSNSSGSGKEGSDQGSWQVKDAIKKALGITGAVAIAAVIAEATEIADFARKTFFMDTLDEGLIPDEFSRAIVKIYGERGGQCSGCIIASEKDPSLYFVLTAAHCVSDNDYMHIKHPQYSGELIKIRLMQILVDPSTDVAVFLIPSREIRKFQDETGSVLPAIPAKQLARIEPRKSEVILLQGYPGDAPNFYREKFNQGAYNKFIYRRRRDHDKTYSP